MTKTKRYINSLRRNTGVDSILALEEDGYTVKRLTVFQWRVNDRLDLYPTNRKYHDVLTGERGDYQGALDICRRLIR